MSKNTLKTFKNGIYKIASNHVLVAIRKGLICMMPLFLIGSFSVLLRSLPIPAFQEFMNHILGENWKSFLGALQQGTNQIASIGALLAISFFLAKDKNKERSGEINIAVVLLISISCFFIINNVEEGALTFSHLGTSELILAIIIAVIAPTLLYFFYNHKIFKAKLFTDDADTLLMQSLSILEPAAWTLICFALFKTLLIFFGITDLYTFMYDTLKSFILPQEGNLASALFYIFFLHFFWFFGIHGSNVTDRLAKELWIPQLQGNIDAVQTGLLPTHILAKPFFDIFVTLGGCGATLCLIIALLIKAKKTNSCKLAKFSFPMSLFNINEPLVFGVPIVLNPIYLIPFLFVPVVLGLITYLAMALHLVPVPSQTVPWTTPIFISGYLATGSIRGSLLQLVNLIVGIGIYAPFVVMSERLKEEAHFKVLKDLNYLVEYPEMQRVPSLINRQDEIGNLIRALAHDLNEDLNEGTHLFLMFQPQMNAENNLSGCEALLRWNHAKFGFIPPPTIITIAEESGIHNRLNEWIFTTALEAQNRFKLLGNDQLIMSVNISPLQLNNSNILQILKTAIQRYHLNPAKIEVEITENVALDDSPETRKALTNFKNLGIRLAIDDFGMGHTSIQYIRSFQFDTVKLDGSLVSDMLSNESSKDIIRALVSLAANLDMHVIAEFVENEEQKSALLELGCRIYQGYFYSKPLPIDTFENYISKIK